ncbi:MAG: hypothetical protein KGL39_21845 [Patescibacteria group bacterium]|nr:hypothetical protein [Patescibacteria group bacterium]
MTRFLIHSPKFTRTPRALAALVLNCRTKRFDRIERLSRKLALLLPGPDGAPDIFAAYPANLLPHILPGDQPAYSALAHFAALGKGAQRLELEAAGIPTLGATLGPVRLPPGRWLVRPNHHFGGSSMVLQDGGSISRGTYAAELMPIRKEFRTVFVHGAPLFTMFKPPADNPDAEAMFEEKWSYTRLDRCGLLEKLIEFFAIQNSSYCAVDIAWFGRRAELPARVIELNFAPGLGPRNLETVANAL